MNHRAIGLTTVLVTLLGAWSCGDRDAGQTIPVRLEPGLPGGAPAALQTVDAEPAHLRTGPGGEPFEVARRTAQAPGGHSRRIGTETFDISLREVGLTTYPCTSCHVGDRIIDRERVADAHQNIQPLHPAETGAACLTCHVSGDVERLALQSGETATLDQSYRLCAQCHFRQVEAWAGGAHGKRLDAWRGRRIVMACTDCHDPHQPGTRKRIPFPGPRLPAGH